MQGCLLLRSLSGAGTTRIVCMHAHCGTCTALALLGPRPTHLGCSAVSALVALLLLRPCLCPRPRLAPSPSRRLGSDSCRPAAGAWPRWPCAAWGRWPALPAAWLQLGWQAACWRPVVGAALCGRHQNLHAYGGVGPQVILVAQCRCSKLLQATNVLQPLARRAPHWAAPKTATACLNQGPSSPVCAALGAASMPDVESCAPLPSAAARNPPAPAVARWAACAARLCSAELPSRARACRAMHCASCSRLLQARPHKRAACSIC